MATPTSKDIWVNTLWFSSLTISISAALVAVLTKQWLYHYMSPTSGTSQEQSRVQQFRYEGLEKYRVPVVIDFLPVALHISMALFLAGLTLFLSSLNLGITIFVGVLSGLAYAAYFASIFFPLFDPQCPYQSPISTYLYPPRRIFLSATRAFRYSIIHITRAFISKCDPTALEGKSNACVNYLSSYLNYLHSLPPPPVSAKEQELQAVSQHRNQLDINAITWLHSTSSNATVRDVSFQAVVGLTPSDGDTSRLREVIRPHYNYLIQSCGISQHSDVLETRTAEYYYAMQAVCINGFEGRSTYWTVEDIETTEQNGQHIFSHILLPPSYHFYASLSAADFSCFISPGPRAHVRLPLSIWTLCFPRISGSFSDPLSLTWIIRECIPITVVQEVRICDPIDTFTNAVRYNPYLRSLLLDALLQHFELSVVNKGPSNYVPLIYQTIDWAIQLFRRHSNGNEGTLSQVNAVQLFTACVERLSDHEYDLIRLRNVCRRVLAHELAHESTEVGWSAYCISARVLCGIWNADMSCSRELLGILMSHLSRPGTPPIDTRDIDESLKVIPEMMRFSSDPSMFYDMLREHDQLPLKLALAGGDGSYRSQFWRFEMCRIAVFAAPGAYHTVDTTSDWAVRWCEYIDCPERLFFIFKNLLPYRLKEDTLLPYRLKENTLLERVTPLIDLTANSSHWGGCFGMLIGLLGDTSYINSIQEAHNPRRRLSDVLVYMQQIMSLPSLYPYRIPRFNHFDYP